MRKTVTVITITLAMALALLLSGYYAGKQSAKPEIVTVTNVDTILVTHTIRETYYEPKYIPVIDTVYIDGITTEIARLDTLVTGDRYAVQTKVNYFYPQRHFSFWQDIAVEVDTVYVNKETVITQTQIKNKTDWWARAGCVLAGVLIGILTKK